MSSTASIALELVARASLLLGLGALGALLFNRRSASLRHLIWSASLGGTLVLAVLVPWTPRFKLPIAGWRAPSNDLLLNVPNEADVSHQTSFADGVRRRAVGNLANVRNVGNAANIGNVVRSRLGRAGTPLWLMVWFTGAGLVLAWMLIGRIGLARLARRGQLVTEGAWRTIVDAASSSVGLRCPVAIYVSPDVGAPMTWGMRRPVLVVPPESLEWSEDLLRSVATHEVAHVVRRDYLHQLIATVTCAVYWFHPFIWMTAFRMRQAAERACDDQVLKLGTAGEDYASHLIGVARNSRELRLSGAVAIGMARASTLEGRIVAVLDPTRVRGETGLRGRRIVAMVAAALMLLVGGVRPVPVASAAPEGITTIQPPDVVGGLTMRTSGPTEGPAVKSAPIVAEPAVTVTPSQDSTFERSFNVTAGGTLVLDLDAGGGVTVTGWDEPRVSVKALLSGRDWRDVEVNVERESDGVRVSALFAQRARNQSTSNHFEIRVPRRYDVRISSAGGSFSLKGLEGRFTGNTGGGELVLDRLTGSARLTTGGGEISVTDSDLSGSVGTGGGTVRISNVRGGLRGSSGSGPVIYGDSIYGSRRGSTTDLSSVNVSRDGAKITVGGTTVYAGGTLNIEKAGGDVDLNAAPNGARVHTGGGTVTIGRAGGDVVASTGGGDVSVGPASGSVRAGTGAGEVHIVVDRGRGSDQLIEASSGKGRIIIELPSDFSGRLDLETAHTRTHEETARIRSDWELEREPLTDWDDRYGTPRRFLRATAVIGRGNGRVVVRTVNGEIEIRRR